MLNIKKTVLSIVFIQVLLCYAQAQVITLKSGKVFNGEIIERAKDYIKVKYSELEVYYENKYIKSIEEEPVHEPVAATQVQKPAGGDDLPSLKKAIELAAAGNFSEARQMLEKQLDDIKGALSILDAVEGGSLSRQFAVYLFEGSLHIINEEYRLAATSLEKAWEISPQDADVNFNLGFVYFSLGEYDKSIAYLSVVLKFQPEDTAAYELIAKDYCNIGEYQKAKDNLSLAGELLKKNGDEKGASRIDELLRIVSEITP
ncbi:MAG: tetratricopeptide repeat protein [Candidatus Omnitrophica bacterium]|nr:tetratricopeptide repeat protein [Candidatus Omnitrophota bacterium]